LVFLPKEESEKLDYKNKKFKTGEKIGVEYLMEGEFEKAVEIYQQKKKESPDLREVQEGSYNTYDSLGEAYMEKGEKALAIENYKKSYELNNKNTNALERIKQLEGKE